MLPISEWDTFDKLFALGGVIFLGAEVGAIYLNNKLNLGPSERLTATRKVIRWALKSPKTRRAILLVGFGWLFYHFGFQYF